MESKFQQNTFVVSKIIKKYRDMSIGKVDSRIVGLLFIFPLFFYGIGNSLVEVLLTSNSLIPVSLDIKIGGFLMILNSITVTALGILLFPILSIYHKGIATTYLISRILEAVLLLVGIIGLFSMIPLGQNFVENKINNTDYQYFINFSSGINYYSYQISMLILGLGSIPFCYLMYKQQMIPNYLSLWGCSGYGLLFIGSTCEFFGLEVGVMLSIPGGLFELSFGFWLLIKGFQNID